MAFRFGWLQSLPRWTKVLVLTIWIGWKVVLLLVTLYYVRPTPTSNATTRQLQKTNSPRLLYIVTSLAEYNNGRRDTIKGQDRLADVMLPTVKTGLQSLQNVDVYFILAYTLSPTREAYIRQQLQDVKVTIWDDACPLSYDNKKKDQLMENTRALARQHRYVVRDYFHDYDLFVALEDDMVVTQKQMDHFWKVSGDLEQMTELTEQQRARIIPGFVRVEVLLNQTASSTSSTLDPVPLDASAASQRRLDPSICCAHDQDHFAVPKRPIIDQIVLWETTIRAMRVISLQNQDYVLLPGPGKRIASDQLVEGIWSGETPAHYFGSNVTRPSPGEPHLLAQQGGWIMTQKQIARLLDGQLCQGSSFLPPLDYGYRRDGLESMNVEFWSGGYQLYTGVVGGCNLQRVMTFENWDHHWLYHAANNKQRQLAHRLVPAQALWQQLNTIRKEVLED